MENVQVDRLNLIDKLRDNLMKHEEDFEEILKDFDEALVDALKKAQKQMKKNSEFCDIHAILSAFRIRPTSYCSEYRMAITALEWSVDPTISISHHELDNYVNDNWPWKVDFEKNRTLYSEMLTIP